MLTKNTLLLLFCWGFSYLTLAQELISGRVVGQNGEGISGVHVKVLEGERATYSTNSGAFSLSCETPCQLSFTHVNYESFFINLVKPTELMVSLKESDRTLDEVKVEADVVSDIEKVKAIDIQNLATLFGEDDIVKYLVTLPGISNINSFDAGISVRGGSTTENAFLVNGVRIADPKHISTLVTAFDPYILNKAEVYKGGFPSLYNGKLSGYVDMNSSPELEATELAVSAGVISSSIKLGSAFGKEKQHKLKVSGRQSYLHLVSDMYEKREKLDQIPKYSLRDITLSYEWQVRDDWTVSFFGLSSSDDLPLVLNNDNLNKLNWKANSGIVGVTRKLANRGDLSLQIGYNDNDSRYRNESANQKIRSTSSNYSSLLKWSQAFNDKLSLMAGYRFEHSSYNIIEGVDVENESNLNTSLHSLFMDWIYFPTDQWSFTLGANASYFSSQADFIDLAPRFKIQRYSDHLELWLDYARTNQYEEKLPFFTIRSPIDIPVPLGEDNKSATSDQISLGARWNLLEGLSVTVSPFYKYMQHVKDFSADSRSNLDFESIRMLEGIGEAYGVESSLQLNSEKIEASINYTYLKSIRLFDEINDGDIFSPPFDITANISSSIIFHLNQHWSATAFWTYASGVYVTIPGGIIVAKDLTDPNSIVNYVPVYGDRYNYRLPARHRLDLGVNYWTQMGSKTSLKIAGGTYNTYNRQNADFVYFEVEKNDEFFVSFVPKSKMVLPFVPYLSLTFYFK
ncbi:TonB-dependent receptor [Reichenbachiella ulvae]|uniref:TonB-dependent receptor n=1 Tax=Reichenbachiella ulvae TaxID=2980104 RepID=A0ABT3CXY2_9BACT|nr:TonB-dependent receptor [Reichenbachiella ulvae]MCV9388063.1 TonB-dependent receptor [Reichenbachiella ulvae]